MKDKICNIFNTNSFYFKSIYKYNKIYIYTLKSIYNSYFIINFILYKLYNLLIF